MDAWKRELEYIIVDCSPVSVSSDAEVWMNVVDSVLLVVREDRADVRMINDAVDAVCRAGKISPDLSSMRFTRNGSREYRKADTAATDMETMHMETAGRVMRKVQKREVEHMAEHKKDIEIKEQNDEVEIDLGRLIQSMWKSFRKLWWLRPCPCDSRGGGIYCVSEIL